VLRGHLHESEAERVQSTDPECSCLEVAAGCVYEHCANSNAFQWIELHPSPRRVRILHRLFHRRKWQPDRNQPETDQGRAETVSLTLT
jgi:hypothetical protein